MTEQTKPTTRELEGATWRKSTKSVPENCVEATHVAGHVAVRDSKNPGGSPLIFTSSEWNAFLAGAKRGEFDLA